MYRVWLVVGAVAGGLAVAAAAVAAHALGGLPATTQRAVGYAVQMQGWHALALLACGLWCERRPGRLVNLAGAGFTAGMVLFSGSIYAQAAGLEVTGLAPIGGVVLMLAWVVLAASAVGR